MELNNAGRNKPWHWTVYIKTVQTANDSDMRRLLMANVRRFSRDVLLYCTGSSASFEHTSNKPERA